MAVIAHDPSLPTQTHGEVTRDVLATITSKPTKSIGASVRNIISASRLVRPPATGVPVPGAKAGSRLSMSKER